MSAAPAQPSGQQTGNAPAQTIRKHSLKASIWRNETRNGLLYNVTLIRTYRDGDEFKDTSSLGFDDLANAAKLLLDAESWITHQVSRDKAETTEPATAPRRGKSASRDSAS